jgi:outer membrane receptor protein involved in Fe transport
MRKRVWGASLLAIAAAQGAWNAAQAQTVAAAPVAGGGSTAVEEVIVTASKRSEKLQKVPLSVEVLDTRALEQHQVNNLQDYLKFLPSLTTQTTAPDDTTLYMRGIASGSEGNHSGPLPTVGSYLDELPITTIGGTLDVHVYDMARVEVLPGPQGTLYGASSEAGTVRLITNQPNPAKFEAGYDLEGNVVDHGGLGGVAEGFVNIPITDHVAIRLVGFDEHDSGFIDNVPGTRTFATSGETINNSAFVRNNFNPVDTFGGRAALRVELGDDWSITPNVIAQDLRSNGTFGYVQGDGDLNVQRFQPDSDHDRWIQAGATLQGKIGNLDLTYAGGFFVRDQVEKSDYTDYSIFYDQIYGSGANWQDANGNPLPRPLQEIYGKDHFTKESNELRLQSPKDDRIRFTLGAFQEIQQHRIIQDYQIQGFGPQIAVPGWPNTIWLTDQLRTDRDEAVFGELTWDILPSLTVTGGVRPYWYDNSLKGFFGFSEGYDALTGFGSGEGSTGQNCKPGESFEDAPCVNLNKDTTGHGETHKINITYKIDADRMVYFTYSTGYRPGGINRNSNYGGYAADTLTNYELGFKSAWLDHKLHANITLYDMDWNDFQYAFLGPNSLTIIGNAPGANVKGAELLLDYRPIDQLTLSGGATFTDAELSANLCQTAGETCSAAEAQAPAGTQLPYTPAFKGNLTARYTMPIYDWDGFVQGSLVYQTRAQAALLDNDANGQNEKAVLGSMSSFASFDFSAGIQRKKLSVTLFAKNAFDERGELNRAVECTIGICSTVYAYPIQPLTVGLRVSQQF